MPRGYAVMRCWRRRNLLGRTLSLNPGSEYSEGVLRGVIVTLHHRTGLRGYQLVSG
jgi:uncharacterized protein